MRGQGNVEEGKREKGGEGSVWKERRETRGGEGRGQGQGV